MMPVFPTIVAMLIGVSFEEYYAETAMPEESLLWILLALPLCALPGAVAEVLLAIAKRRFRQGRPFEVRRFARLVQHLPLPTYVLCLFVFGWPKIVVPLRVEGAVLVDQVVVLAPYFLALAFALVESMRLRRPFKVGEHGPEPASFAEVRGAVGEQIRHLALAVVPLFGLILILDVAQDTPLRLYFANLPLLSGLALVAVLALLSIVYPLLFRYGMGLKPLIEGAPLRLRLEETARKLDFRCRDILYWPTRRPILNAAIVGVVPRYRYVIFTEELCNRLTLDELGAVFAHEVGHGKRHHAVYYLLFSGVFLAALIPASDFVGRLVEDHVEGALSGSLAALLLFYLPVFAFYWVVLFSYLSRRFELEADIFGVETTGNPALFIDTLEKVARIGRIERRTTALRHFSVAGRTDFLRRAYVEHDVRLLLAFRNRIRQLRKFIVVSAVVVGVAGGTWLLLDTLRGAGHIFLEKGRPESASSVLRPLVHVRSGDLLGAALLAEAELYVDAGERAAGRTGGRAAPSNGSATPSAGAAHERWSRLLDTAARASAEERDEALDVVRAGWSRAVVAGRSDVALLMVRRAEELNALGTTESADEVALELADMKEATLALARLDREALASLLDRMPRWLRRPSVLAARESLETRLRQHRN